MPDYKTMYFQLFNKITDAINILQKAQKESEEKYIQSSPAPLISLNNTHKQKKE